jgi:hypothetical protein
MAQQAKASSLLRFHDHTQLDTDHSVGLLCTSDQPVAEISTWKYTTLTTDIHAPGGIQTRNPSKQAAADRQRQSLHHIYICLYIILI